MVGGPLKFHDRLSQFANRCTAAAVIIFVVMLYNFRLLCFFIYDLSNTEWIELIIKKIGRHGFTLNHQIPLITE